MPKKSSRRTKSRPLGKSRPGVVVYSAPRKPTADEKRQAAEIRAILADKRDP